MAGVGRGKRLCLNSLTPYQTVTNATNCEETLPLSLGHPTGVSYCVDDESRGLLQ